MKHLERQKPHTVYTRFRKTDDVFVPLVPKVLPPVADLYIETSKRSVAAALVIVVMFSTLFVSAGKQLGTLAYFSDTETTLANQMRAGEWESPEAVVEVEAFSLFTTDASLVEEETPVVEEGVVAGVADAVVEEEPQTETPVVEETQAPPAEEPAEEVPVVEEPQPESTEDVPPSAPEVPEEIPPAPPSEESPAPVTE